MRFNNPKLINDIGNLVNRYSGFSGIANQDYVVEGVNRANEKYSYDVLKKDDKFEIYIEYGDPETIFHIELYKNDKRSSSRMWEDDRQDLIDCQNLIQALLSNDDVTSEANPNFKPAKPYEAPRTTLEGTIGDVNESLRQYKLECKVNVLCAYEDKDRNFATMIIEYEKCTQQELDYFDEQYYEGGQYDHDCKHEQWDWLKNEC